MPKAKRTVVLKKTLVVPRGKTVDYNYTRFVPHKRLGDGSQKEGQRPAIILMPGARILRVIIAAPGVDGIHCMGKNKLIDVWFEDVGEDAVTVSGKDVRWIGGGARKASDKIVQVNHRGPFYGENLWFENFGTGVRGCGDKRFRKTPFDIRLKDIGAKNGRTLLRLTSKGARGQMERIRVDDVDDVYVASNGAKVKVKD